MKKVLALILALSMLMTMAFAAGALAESRGSIEVAVTYTGDQLQVFKGLMEKFTEETGIEVVIDEYGDDYEATMKTRMAANTMPDVFQTHGWSLLRYVEYLMPLNDQPWFEDYDESALGVIADENGTVYVLMLNELVNCTLVNRTVCEEAGVDPYSINTWDDLLAACEKIKAIGKTPIGSNSGSGIFANIAGTFVTYEGESNPEPEAQLNGTYDWTGYQESLMAFVKTSVEAGYWAEDVLTRSNDDMTQKFAEGSSAFMLGNDPGFLISALTLNPDGDFIILPNFASAEGGTQEVNIGEGDTFGIWNETPNEELAKELLIFLAKPENASEINAITGKVACLKSSMAMDTGYGLQKLTEMQEMCADRNIFYDNLWDRKYMPSGMWGIFGNACNDFFGDLSDENSDAVIEYLRENYNDLYEAANG
jgi:raffinose/stachyose/melibiose transport system substrate-binding protein